MRVDRYGKADDHDNDDVTWDPSERQPVPERTDGKGTECTLGNISVSGVDEGQCSHKDW
jgi:hypothetical protein